MIFHSTYSENVKRIIKNRKIATFEIEDSNFLFKVDKEIKKHNLKKENVRFYKDSFVDEFGSPTDKIVLYHPTQETDEEYKKRIKTLEIKDLDEFLRVLSLYNSACKQKDDIWKLLKKLVTSNKYSIPDWQKQQVEQFFNIKLNGF